MNFDTSKYEETRKYWMDYNKFFKETVYPDLFAPFGISFDIAYQVYAIQYASYNWSYPGPPNTSFTPVEEKEPWE